MFTDEEFADLLMCLDMALEDGRFPLTSFGIQKVTALREKVQSLRDAAPNKACSGLPFQLRFREYVAGQLLRFVWWLANSGSR